MSITLYRPRNLSLYRTRRPGFGSLSREVNEIFDNLLFGGDSTQHSTGSSGKLQIDYGEDAVTVTAVVPGVEREELHISYRDGALHLSAKNEEAGDEYAYGFETALPIEEEVDDEKITAALKNGILTVSLPKREVEEPKEIEISVG